MHDIHEEDIGAIIWKMALFTQPNKLETMYLADANIKPTKNHQDNGAFLELGTQPSFSKSPLIDTPVAPDKPPPCPCIDAGNTSFLTRVGELPEVRLQGSDNVLLGVYQYWMHQNPGNHIYGRITEDGKWKARSTQSYDAPSRKFGRKFASTHSVELKFIRTWKWNSERVIIFQSVILQRAQSIH